MHNVFVSCSAIYFSSLVSANRLYFVPLGPVHLIDQQELENRKCYIINGPWISILWTVVGIEYHEYSSINLLADPLRTDKTFPNQFYNHLKWPSLLHQIV